MALTIPQQRLIRFLVTGNKWSVRDAFCTDRLAIFSRYHSYSLHRPHSLRFTNFLSHPSLCYLLRLRSPPLRSMTTALSDPPQSPPTKTVRVVVKGRVQGVFYRNWTIENATQLGLKGWVRNRRDGSVEALFSGKPDSVQEMEQRCRRGPSDALVTALEVFPSSDNPGTGFERKPTV
ncbi:hypothetical protein Patl1_32169 [Pistacia atlantica]|uniref:Uncharacterized protein n=1 Tax=Pistacia atlantica TaxID=434234 RepID=A0ACC1ARX6_9ROSI|nr:hypothetical protein Patl1_32169 [Pistacia atlantica]